VLASDPPEALSTPASEREPPPLVDPPLAASHAPSKRDPPLPGDALLAASTLLLVAPPTAASTPLSEREPPLLIVSSSVVPPLDASPPELTEPPVIVVATGRCSSGRWRPCHQRPSALHCLSWLPPLTVAPPVRCPPPDVVPPVSTVPPVARKPALPPRPAAAPSAPRLFPGRCMHRATTVQGKRQDRSVMLLSVETSGIAAFLRASGRSPPTRERCRLSPSLARAPSPATSGTASVGGKRVRDVGGMRTGLSGSGGEPSLPQCQPRPRHPNLRNGIEGWVCSDSPSPRRRQTA